MTVNAFTEIDVPLEYWPAERLNNCWYCGQKLANTRGFTVETTHGSNRVSVPSGYARLAREHQIPRSRNGNAGSNIVAACDSCNESKSTKTVEEYRTYLSMSGTPVVFYGESHNG
jgi:5-methylcytosine-specific restriction endonuclease McrA